jgi:hypothetical protein
MLDTQCINPEVFNAELLGYANSISKCLWKVREPVETTSCYEFLNVMGAQSNRFTATPYAA